VETYYRLALTGVGQSVFEQHQVAIDRLLQKHAPDVLEKVPAISERLGAGDPGAVSQAMNSCRRMIKAFADAVYPPGDSPVAVDGRDYQVGSDKVLNRIELHMHGRCASKSRAERIAKNLRRIHARASAGSHAEVTADEARALFLQVYLTLGEALSCTSRDLHGEAHEEASSSGLP